MEAMLCGLPAVVSAVGDLGDVVCDGENGFLVRTRTPEEFADRILRLIQDPVRLMRCSRAALRTGRRYELAAAGQLWDRVLPTPDPQPAAGGRGVM